MPARQTTAGRIRSKGPAVMAAVLLALGVIGVTTQTWLKVDLPKGPVRLPGVEVTGNDAATAATALAVAALAAGLASAVAGAVARGVAAAVLAIAGAGIAWISWRTASLPEQAAAPAVGHATGLGDVAGASITVTAMPWIAGVLGILLIAVAAVILTAGRTWAGARRYSTSPAEAGDRAQVGAADQGAGAAAAADVREDDDIDSWDRLSRGEDPTG
jgi:hypothetical protein